MDTLDIREIGSTPPYEELEGIDVCIDDDVQFALEQDMQADICMHAMDVIDQYGASVITLTSLDMSVNIYSEIPSLLDLEDLPYEGNSDSSITVLALESIGKIADKFWVWVQKICASIRDAVSTIMDRVKALFSKSETIVANQATTIMHDRHLIDTSTFGSRSANLIAYQYHSTLLKSLPSMHSELYTVCGNVMAIDWMAALKEIAKAAAITVTGTVFTAAIGGALKLSMFKRLMRGAKLLKVLKNIPVRSVNNVRRITGGKLMFASMSTWRKMGCKLTPNGAMDMSDFLQDHHFYPKRGTISSHGWDIAKVTDVKELLAVFDLVKKMAEMNRALDSKIVEMEKELKLLSSMAPEMHPKFVEAAKLGLKIKLSMMSSSQRVSASMVKTVMMLVKNMINAQRAVYACKKSNSREAINA